MFRRTKKTKELEQEQELQFFKVEFLEKKVSRDELLLSVSVGAQNQCHESKKKKDSASGLFSCLFRKKEKLLSISAQDLNQEAPSAATARQTPNLRSNSFSFSKSRDVLDQSESIILDLPRVKLNICGSSSAAQFLLNEFPREEFYQAIEGLLINIFDSNLETYKQLKEKDRIRKEQLSMMLRVINGENLKISTTATMNSLELCLEKMSKISEEMELELSENDNEPKQLQTLNDIQVVVMEGLINSLDNEKASAPIPITKQNLGTTVLEVIKEQIEEDMQRKEEKLKDFEIKCKNDENVEIKSDNNLSRSSSAISYKPGQKINAVEHSFEELTEMFDLLKVRSPEKLDDWTLRYVVEDSAGESEESLRFEMWSREGIIIKENEVMIDYKLGNDNDNDNDIDIDIDNDNDIDIDDNDKNLKPLLYSLTRSHSQTKSCVDLLNMTEITTSTNNLKTRCLSLTPLKSFKMSEEGLVRRKSLGARVSKIVAIFENAGNE